MCVEVCVCVFMYIWKKIYIAHRCAVVGSYTTEDYFLEKEGVFHLLDLLEVGNM